MTDQTLYPGGHRPESPIEVPPDELHPPGELSAVRRDISEIDRRIVELLSDRVRLGRQAHALKAHAGLDVFDPEREAAVIRDAAERAAVARLDQEPVRELFWRIIRLTREAGRD